MNNTSLAWILFYIAAGILGIFLTVVYMATKKTSRKKSA